MDVQLGEGRVSMFDCIEDVAVDLVCAMVNPDAEACHPLARKVFCIAWVGVTPALMAHIYAADGVIAL